MRRYQAKVRWLTCSSSLLLRFVSLVNPCGFVIVCHVYQRACLQSLSDIVVLSDTLLMDYQRASGYLTWVVGIGDYVAALCVDRDLPFEYKRFSARPPPRTSRDLWK